MIQVVDHGPVIRRHELSDVESEFIRPLLPRSLRGRKRLDDQTILNGIVWKFQAGVAWRDVPERYGPSATLHTRFRRWAKDRTFTRMLQAAQARADAADDIDWLVSVDCTIVRAHQHAGRCPRRGTPDPWAFTRRSDQQDSSGLRGRGDLFTVAAVSRGTDGRITAPNHRSVTRCPGWWEFEGPRPDTKRLIGPVDDVVVHDVPPQCVPTDDATRVASGGTQRLYWLQEVS
ncbi:transposase [Streptomyces sp. NPDC005908]|uniref:transposase n=1 Tax=Streptomyces sp. NPDC005908 TaxID=3157084 RepID=UPI0033CB00C9